MSLRYSSLGRSAAPPLASLWSGQSASPPGSHGSSGGPLPQGATATGQCHHANANPNAKATKFKPGPMDFTPDELASQMTLLDIDLFKKITPDEVISCLSDKKKKKKFEVAPHVSAFTQKFNHVSYWVSQEILKSDTAKGRAEILTHFIKVAKKLHELNNLNSLFAVLSALNNASVFRLAKTWALIRSKDRQGFDKLTELFSQKDNFTNLREYMDKTALKHQPCIPYLGLYLTDLVFIDVAHQHSGCQQQWQDKMNNILRILSEFQQSSYAHLTPLPDCQQYLKSIRYIDELQRFLSEEHWKLSLKLEPIAPSITSSSSSSKESVHSRDPNVIAELNLSPAKGCCTQVRKFVPGHRKSRSDGGSLFWACTAGASTSNEALPTPESLYDKSRHHLLDGSLIDTPSPCKPPAAVPARSVAVASCNPDLWKCQQRFGQLDVSEPGTKCAFEGVVKRKTLIKEGRRPTVTGWQRYWIELWGSSLVFYSPKPLSKGLERSDYRSDPTKFRSISGWVVMVATPGTAYGSADTTDQLSFQLNDPAKKNVYRFRATSPEAAQLWVQFLYDAVRGVHIKNQMPTNLISFE